MYNYTVIIPHYNSYRSLIRLLETIPDRKDIQIIVINECGTVSEFCEKENSEIIFFCNTPTIAGPGYSRNIGLNHAKGKWILFADDDDYYLKGAFDILDDYIGSKEDIIYFGFTSVYDDTMEEGHRHIFHMKRLNSFLLKKDSNSENFLKYRWPQVWSKLIKRALLESNNIRFRSILISEDSLFSYRAAHLARSIAGDRRKIYCLTRSTGSLTMRHNEDLFNIRLDAALEVFHFLKGKISKKHMPPALFKLVISSRRYGFKKICSTCITIIKMGGNPFCGFFESLKVFFYDLKYREKDNRYKIYCKTKIFK